MSLRTCMNSIPDAIATSFAHQVWLEKRLLTFTTFSVNQIIESFLYHGCPVMSIHTGHRYLYTLYPFQEVYLQISFSDLFVTSSPFLFLLNLGSSSQTLSTSHESPESSISGHPSFFPLDDSVYCLKFCPQGKNPSLYDAIVVYISWYRSTLYRSIRKH